MERWSDRERERGREGVERDESKRIKTK